MEYTIEQLGLQHLSLGESLFETRSNMAESPLLDEDKMTELLKKMNDQGSIIFVAVSKEHGIIWTTTLLVEQKMIRWWGISAHIEDVVTRKWFTGQGVARSIMDKAIQEARAKWCYKIILDCEDELVPFYEKSGFKEEWTFMRMYLK